MRARSLVCLVAAAVSSCSSPSQTDAGPEVDCGGRCVGGTVCIDTKCYAQQCSAERCGTLEVCVSGTTEHCEVRTCVGTTCPSGQSCTTSGCVSTSCGAVACGADEVCISNTCQDRRCVGVSCPTGSACAKGVCEGAGGGGGSGGGGGTGGSSGGSGGGGGGGAGGTSGGGGTGGGGTAGGAGNRLTVTPQPLILAPGTSGIAHLTYSGMVPNNFPPDLRVEGGTQLTWNFFGALITSGDLTLTAAYPYDAGNQSVTVTLYGDDGGMWASAPLQLVVRPGSGTLIVDDDIIGGNQTMTPALSPEDVAVLAAVAARGAPYDRFIMPFVTDGGELPLSLMRDYTTVVWYTGQAWSPLFTFLPQNETLVGSWLDLGGRKLVFISDGYFYSMAPNVAAFTARYLGGTAPQHSENFNAPNYTFHGVAGQPSAGIVVGYGANDGYIDFMTPKPGATTLFIEAVPDSGSSLATRYITDAGSTVVHCGFGMDEIRAPDAGGTRRAVLDALFNSAGF